MQTIFQTGIIAVAVIFGLTAAWIFGILKEKQAWRALAFVSGVAVLVGIYILATGAYLLGGWSDPLATTDPNQVSEVTSRGRNGLIVLAIRYWPYFLLGFGALVSYLGWLTTKEARANLGAKSDKRLGG